MSEGRIESRNSNLIPSGRRPDVPCRDRLQLWLPWCARHALDENGKPTNLTKADLDKILAVLLHAWADSTREVYGSGLLAYHVFCDRRGIPETHRAPASNTLIAAFIASLAGLYAATTIRNYVSGVRAWHILHGVAWSMNEIEVEGLLKAASALAPSTSKRKQRQPFTVDYITAIRNSLDLDLPLHAAVFACLTTTFYAAARLGEFVVKTLGRFSAAVNITRLGAREEVDEKGLHSMVFRLPATKTAPTGEDVSWSAQDGVTDPRAAFEVHLRINNPPGDAPLFAYRDHKYSRNKLKPLTKAKFIEVVHAAARDAGLDPLQGHGIRIGSTLEYLLRGVPFEVMKVKGRWASDAFQLYLRKHAQILAPYMQARSHQHEEFIRITMPPVR